ncbi:small integral membrane protein 12-A-like [Oppia nitens]|uniref:small integral membrane protein 12-A-like n=1 Tax=Oppia nitens TaxID=1686743 RepID=UPI0023DBEE2F|nr:small integral membrane protein 12-A-like [Oppia nitens]
MIPVIWAAARAYTPYLVFPFAVVIGAVGYKLEWTFSDVRTQGSKQKDSIDKERSERQLRRLFDDPTADATEVESLKRQTFVPKNIFERNVSPSLQMKTTTTVSAAAAADDR